MVEVLLQMLKTNPPIQGKRIPLAKRIHFQTCEGSWAFWGS